MNRYTLLVKGDRHQNESKFFYAVVVEIDRKALCIKHFLFCQKRGNKVGETSSTMVRPKNVTFMVNALFK